MLFDLNASGEWLSQEIKEEWEDEVKAIHRLNRERLIARLTMQYGEINIEDKLTNIRDIGGQALTINSWHNNFYRQARDAFIIGAYYPSLTAACALGERLLNHLVLGLRDVYKNEPGWEQFLGLKSSSNWRGMIRTLEESEILLPTAVTEYRALMEARHRAIHFNHNTASRDRDYAITALKHLSEILSVQFGVFRGQPWFIPDVAGTAFIKRNWEDNPFVKLVWLPASWLVGPGHWMDYDQNTNVWTLHDRDDYEGRSISDAEYIQLYEQSRSLRISANKPKP
jgi:hypothetical protein